VLLRADRMGFMRGDLTGPSPVDRGKPGSKIHVLSDRGGPLSAVAVSAANVHDSQALKPLVEAIPAIRFPSAPAGETALRQGPELSCVSAPVLARGCVGCVHRYQDRPRGDRSCCRMGEPALIGGRAELGHHLDDAHRVSAGLCAQAWFDMIRAGLLPRASAGGINFIQQSVRPLLPWSSAA
jgi:hypothetical protein